MGVLIFFILLILLELVVNSLIFPLPVSDRDRVRYKTIPWATITLIGLNTLVFLAWQAPDLAGVLQSQTEEEAIFHMYNTAFKTWTYGYRGSFMWDGGASIGAFTTFTSMFMHADPSHLFFNMVYLWSFGRRVEDACGPWRYLLFYLFAGMVANMFSVMLNPTYNDIPGIGASGAISGVMGAYLILFPGSWVSCFWGIGLGLRIAAFIFAPLMGEKVRWAWTIRFPAILVLVFNAVTNIIPSFEVIQQGKALGGVNNLAHLTGYLAALLIFLYVRKDLLVRYLSGRSL